MEFIQTFTAKPLNYTHYVMWIENAALQTKGFNNQEDAQLYFDGLGSDIKRSFLLETITERYTSDGFELSV